MRGVLAAPAAELLQFQTVRCRFAVLGLRIVPLFAITTLQRNNLSGHCSLPNLALEFPRVGTAAFVRPGGANPLPHKPTYQSRRSCPRPPSARLRESRSAILFPSPPV